MKCDELVLLNTTDFWSHFVNCLLVKVNVGHIQKPMVDCRSA